MLNGKGTRRLLSLLVATIMVLGFLTPSLYASNNGTSYSRFASIEEAQSKIDLRVMEKLEEEEFVEILVYMDDQVDTTKIAMDIKNSVSRSMSPFTTKKEVRNGVVDELRLKASRSQEKLIRYLEIQKQEGKVREFKSYSIINMVYARVNKEVVEGISQMTGVGKIYGNQTYQSKDFGIEGEQANGMDIELSSNEIAWNIDRINAPQAWHMGYDGTGMTIAIIDTGVDWTHPALKNNWRGYNPKTEEVEPSGNWYDPVYNFELPSDFNGIGTHVAGTALGHDQDGNIKIGVAPGARWIAARVYNSTGQTHDRYILDALDWVLAPGGNPEGAPDIVNVSFAADASNYYRNAVRALRDAEIVPVFPVGDKEKHEFEEEYSIGSPANYPESLAVTAVDRDDMRPEYPKLGPSPFDSTIIKPEVSAPGVRTISAVPGGGYAGVNSGTYIATPHVSGMAALLLSVNSSLSVEEIKDAIIGSASPLTDSEYKESPNIGYGYGMIDALEAVSSLIGGTATLEGRLMGNKEDLEEASIIHEQEIFQAYSGVPIDIAARIMDNVAVTEVELMVKEGNSSFWAIIPMEQVSGDLKDGVYEGTIPADMMPEGGISYRVKAKDYSGRTVTTKDYKIDIALGIIPDKYNQNFESIPTGWRFDGSWAWGIPSGISPKAHSGEKLVGTHLSQEYPDFADDWLITPPIDLRDENLDSVTFRYFEWYDIHEVFGKGFLLLSDDNGKTWTELKPAITGDGSKWKERVIDLSKYIGSNEPIHIAFNLVSIFAITKAGWYIDDVRLIATDNEPPATPRNLELRPNLTGIEVSWEEVSDSDLSHYALYRSTNLDNDYELLTEVDGNRMLDTQVESGIVYHYKVLAKDFSGNESGFSNIESSSIIRTEEIFGTDFEEDDGGFTAILLNEITGEPMAGSTQWKWGKPSFGPKAAFSGEKLWTTNLSGAAPSYKWAYIESKTISLPDEDNIYLTFKHWFNMGTDGENFGEVYISADGGDWTNITPGVGQYNRRTKGSKKWLNEEISISKYKGKDIKIAFIEYREWQEEAGWYIDDVYILKTEEEILYSQTNQTSNLIAIEESNKVTLNTNNYILTEEDNYEYERIEDSKVQNMPLAREKLIPVDSGVITVVESGLSNKIDPLTGRFRMKVPSGKLTIRAEGYGYFTKEVIWDVDDNDEIQQDIILEPKSKGHIQGRVSDRYSKEAISGVKVQVIEDNRIKPVISDDKGQFSLEDVYEGSYTLRLSSENVEMEEVTVEVIAGETTEIDWELKRFVGHENIIQYDNDHLSGAVFMQGRGQGTAIRVTPREYGIVEGVYIYFTNDQFVFPNANNRIGIAIYEIDEYENATMIGQEKEIVAVLDEWNYVDLREYEFATDKDFYISTIYTQSEDNSPGIGFDATSYEGDRAYANYNGDFKIIRKVLDVPNGVFIMRTVMKYSAGVPEITNMGDVAYTNQDKITMEGRVIADGKVNIYVDGEKKSSVNSKEGRFLAEIELTHEESTIMATLEVKGEETEPSREVRVVKDKVKPVLLLDGPVDQERFKTDVVHVVGNVTDDVEIKELLINGVESSVDRDGNFKERLILDPGVNTITVKATDIAGNETIVERTVYINLESPVISNIEPSKDITVKSGEVVSISFEAPTAGKAYFEISMPFKLANSEIGSPMIENDGIYSAKWMVPEGLVATDLHIYLTYVDEYGIKVSELALGKVTVIGDMGDLKSNTIIIDGEAFDVHYLEGNIKLQDKLTKAIATNLPIFVKLADELIVDIDGNVVSMDELPVNLTYYDGDGNLLYYEK